MRLRFLSSHKKILLTVLVVLCFCLFALYTYELRSTQKISDPVADELEQGRLNKNPYAISMTVRAQNREDICSYFCLDQSVAPGIKVFLVDDEERSCETQTLEALIWEHPYYRGFPVTPLRKEESCLLLQEPVLAFFTSEKPHLIWKKLSKSVETVESLVEEYKNNQRLKEELIESSAKAEGTLILSESIFPAPPIKSQFKSQVGQFNFETLRYFELRDDGTPGEYKSAYTKYSFNGENFLRVSDTNLFCSEIESAFDWNGKFYLQMKEWGCDSDLVCDGIFSWTGSKFEIVYGNCN